MGWETAGVNGKTRGLAFADLMSALSILSISRVPSLQSAHRDARRHTSARLPGMRVIFKAADWWRNYDATRFPIEGKDVPRR
jgi:hypothetical protein